jgi:hypothetical protein
LALEEVSGQLHSLAATPRTQWLERWVGHKAGLDAQH